MYLISELIFCGYHFLFYIQPKQYLNALQTYQADYPLYTRIDQYILVSVWYHMYALVYTPPLNWLKLLEH